MDSRILLRQLLRNPSTSRTILTPTLRPQPRTFALFAHTLPHPRYLSLPRIIQPSFWASMIPTFGHTRPSSGFKSNEWNPATPYIILSLLVGSQAIHVLWLKRDRNHDMRRAEAKIQILREVIERVQRGEDVDVEKVLGTGVESEEREWAEVIKEIEEEEVLFQSRKKRRMARAAAAGKDAGVGAKEAVDDGDALLGKSNGAENGTVKVETYNGGKFY